MKNNYVRTRLYSRPDLKERGWTKTMMEQHLPDPDDYRDNPYYKCSGAMPMWLKSRVHRIEKRKTFQRDMVKVGKRRAAGEARRMEALAKAEKQHAAEKALRIEALAEQLRQRRLNEAQAKNG